MPTNQHGHEPGIDTPVQVPRATPAGPRTALESDGKLLGKLRAAFALRGHCLHSMLSEDGTQSFNVQRWGLVRHLATVDDVRRFLAQIGGEI